MASNTYIDYVINLTNDKLCILDAEDQRFKFALDAKTGATWKKLPTKSIVFSWVNNDIEVKEKAIRVTNNRTKKCIFYIFQYWQKDKIYYIKPVNQ